MSQIESIFGYWGGTQRTHPDDALFMDAASSLGVSLEELARGVEQVPVKAQRETEMAPKGG